MVAEKPPIQKRYFHIGGELPPEGPALNSFVTALANLTQAKSDRFALRAGTTKKVDERVKIEEDQLRLLKNLSEIGIDPRLFDLMLSNELDRSLKRKFGMAFLFSTIFFTLLSYLVIVLNSILKWGISDTAITSLIVETPIQFIGLLYIIARNLFPQSGKMVAAAPAGVSPTPPKSPAPRAGTPRTRIAP
jgi:hypothetical protein